MKNLDCIYLKCLGYKINWSTNSLSCISTGNAEFLIDNKGKVRLTVQWAIPLGDKKETNKVLKQLHNYVIIKQEEIDKINKLLSIPDNEKKKFIIDNLERIDFDEIYKEKGD